jgi:hypothetical protein
MLLEQERWWTLQSYQHGTTKVRSDDEEEDLVAKVSIRRLIVVNDHSVRT